MFRAPGRGRLVASAGAFLSVVFLCNAATAQNAVGVIERRIESTFDLVIGNAADLAIPLTRRALARRSAEDQEGGDPASEPFRIDPLAYSDPQSIEPSITSRVSGAIVDETSVEEGSWEGDPAAEVEVARLPRPRPDRVTASADDVELAADDAPLDLVAGAPVAAPELPRSDLVAAGAPASGSVAKHIPAEDQPILPAAATAPAPELVASSACLSPDAVADKDGDFKRNADTLSGSAFCIEEETFKERRRNWTLQTVKTNRPGPLWAVMHDDEDMSFDNAVEALRTYGGTLVTVDTGGKRNMDGIDPNRNFSADGIGCSKLGDNAAPRYTAFFRDLITDEPIIALHNNFDGKVPTGGLGHASMASASKDMQAIPTADQKSPLAGERNLVLLTSIIPVTTTTESRAKALAAKGINAMIEKIRDKGDCSLSNYALLTGHPDYLNVTVDHDEREKQRKIVDVIMSGRNDAVATQ